MQKLSTPVKVIAIIAFMAALGIALLGLVAPLGVWLGMWDFRLGFNLLRNAHDYGLWIAEGALGLGLFTLVMSFVIPERKLLKIGVLVVVGSGLASLVYFIPETFRAPEGQNYPPIHDISTDTDNPPEFVAVLPLRANAPNTVVYGGSEGMTPETLAQLQRQAYPDIQPWRTNQDKTDVFNNALIAVDQLGWKLVAQQPEEGRIEATDTTFWFRFKDDIVIKITEENGETVVNARSLSRVGRGDVGANALRLRAFFEKLSKKD